jgi:preprotein translocase subunit SecB
MANNNDLGRQQDAFTMLGIRLIGCDFGYSESDENKIEAALATKTRRSIDYNVELIASTVEPKEGYDLLEIAIRVDAKSKVGDAPWWTITVGYQAGFRVAQGANIKTEDVRTIHGPAHMFAFAREFISDIARRAMISPPVYPPPWNFTPPPAASPAAPSGPPPAGP